MNPAGPSGPRILLRRLREVMAGSGAAQERMDQLVTAIAANNNDGRPPTEQRDTEACHARRCGSVREELKVQVGAKPLQQAHS